MTQIVSSNSIVGIAASKLTGALPAVSGANLTGISAGVYNNASDPTVSSNRTLGTIWANSTTGDLFICTDATSNANVWTNVGSGWNGVGKTAFGGVGGGTQFGYCAGGHTPNSRIDKFAFAGSGVTSSSAGTLTNGAIYMGAGHSSTTHGYVSGGSPNGGTTGNFSVDRFAFASNSTQTMSGLTLRGGGNGKQVCTGHSSTTHGYTAGRHNGTNVFGGIGISKWAYSSSSLADDWGNLAVGSSNAAAHTSYTHGYISGGQQNFPPAVFSNTTNVQRFSLANDSGAENHSTLTLAPNSRRVGMNNETHGYTAGGGNSNLVDKYAFASDASAVDHCDLDMNREANSGCSSTTDGYYMGGPHGSVPNGASICKFSFSSSAQGTDHGDLSTHIFNFGSSGCQQ